MSTIADLSGTMLLALPTIGDPRFHRAVIAMCSHDRNGAMGIDIGSPVEGLTAGDVLGQLAIETADTFDQPVLVGGPVEPQRGFILHSADWPTSDALRVGDRWALSGSVDTLRAIAAGEGPNDWLLALGYAGWGAGQLEDEIVANAWHIGEYDVRNFYHAAPRDKWRAGFAAQGIDADRITAEGGRA